MGYVKTAELRFPSLSSNNDDELIVLSIQLHSNSIRIIESVQVCLIFEVAWQVVVVVVYYRQG